MLALSCTAIGLCLFIFGSFGNGLCILVFLRHKFRYRIITPYFIILLLADSIYLLFRLMKLPYYLHTLFKLPRNITGSCSQTFLVRIFGYATQNWPQPAVPLVHAELYMRFALILMSIMAVQRAIFIARSLKLQILPASYAEGFKYKGTFLIILFAFLLAYIFQLAGSTLFCSRSMSTDIAYDWFTYMSRRMGNTTFLLTNSMTKQPDQLTCVSYAINTLQQNRTLFAEKKPVCTQKDLMDILTHYFDRHDPPTVRLIQKIVLSKTGRQLSPSDVHRKYHFHQCLFPQEPNFFDRTFDFLYSRAFHFNRYTLLLVFGSIIPSLITIVSNILSVYRVQELNRLTAGLLLPSRRRSDDTRRVLLVITVECLFAIVNSWFGQILLSLIYCKKNLLAGDNCPDFLSKNYGFLVAFDLFNSSSNIILHCLCGRRFRDELYRMLQSWFELLKRLLSHIWCCYIRIGCTKVRNEPCVTYKASAARHDTPNSSSHNQLQFNLEPATKSSESCCDCQWYCHRKPLTTSAQCLQKEPTLNGTRNTLLTQQTYATKPVRTSSLRLYRAPENI